MFCSVEFGSASARVGFLFLKIEEMMKNDVFYILLRTNGGIVLQG